MSVYKLHLYPEVVTSMIASDLIGLSVPTLAPDLADTSDTLKDLLGVVSFQRIQILPTNKTVCLSCKRISPVLSELTYKTYLPYCTVCTTPEEIHDTLLNSNTSHVLVFLHYLSLDMQRDIYEKVLDKISKFS